MTDQEAAALGAEALAQVKPGDVVGLGTGQAAPSGPPCRPVCRSPACRRRR
jgi:hypothetical protein